MHRGTPDREGKEDGSRHCRCAERDASQLSVPLALGFALFDGCADGRSSRVEGTDATGDLGVLGLSFYRSDQGERRDFGGCGRTLLRIDLVRPR
jgi:hypothetical protein